MKKLIIFLILAICWSKNYSQSTNCSDCQDDKGIITNPNGPENCEVADAFPNKTNQFLNAFDWAKNSSNQFHSIVLNPNAGWLINDFTTPPVLMVSPFTQTHGYLYNAPPSGINDNDFHWEDGWELMYMNTGYFPNGEIYHDFTQNTNPIVGYDLPLHHQKVPYIVLYNRYTGKMRLFFNVFTDLGQYNDISLDLGYLYTSNVSGVFRHVNGYDTPLDQYTSFSNFSTNFKNGNNNTHWFMTDVQMGYDACVCDYFSKFDFKLKGINSYDVKLYARSISTSLPLRDPTTNMPTYSDFLNMNTIVDANSGKGGAFIYKSLDGMLNAYDNDLKRYKDDLADYNTLGNTAMRSLMGLAKTGLNSSLTGLVPTYILKDLSSNAVRVLTKITDPDDYKNATQWYQQTPGNPSSPWLQTSVASKPEGEEAYKRMQEDAKKYSMSLSKTLKGGIGSLSDAMFTSFYTEPTKPVKPIMPTATFSEMRIAGTIGKVNELLIGDLYNPGSYKFGGSFNPSAYPIYNEPVGLFALLKTPECSVYHHTSSNVWGDRVEPETELYFKLKSPLKYRFNHAVDFDFDKTQMYGQIQIEYKAASEGGPYVRKSGNLKMLNTIPNSSNNTLAITLVSDWVPIELLGEYLFAVKWEQTDDISIWNDNKYPSKEKITLKVMADMYFESQGFDGTEKNTTQVFTYLLYDKGMNIDFIQDRGEYLNYKDQIAKYEPGTLVLENETIELSDYFVNDVIGNTLYINAEDIELKGNIYVESGYNAVLRAFWAINSDPTSEISPVISLEIKRDFYNFPPTYEVTNAELEAFCKTTSTKEYKSNILSEPMREEMEEQIRKKIQKQKSSFDFKVSPNPNNGNFKVSYDLKEKDGRIVVMNIQGKNVFESSISFESNSVDLNLSHLAKGMYLIELISSDKKSTQKVVIK